MNLGKKQLTTTEKQKEQQKNLRKDLKEVKEENDSKKSKELKSIVEKVREITANLKDIMLKTSEDNSEDDEFVSEWVESHTSDLQIKSKQGLKILGSGERDYRKIKNVKNEEESPIREKEDIENENIEIGNSESENDLEKSEFSGQFVEEDGSFNQNLEQQTQPDANLNPIGQLVLLHEKRMSFAEEKMNKIFEMLNDTKIDSKNFSKKLNFLNEKIENFKPPMREKDILDLINQAVDARILKLMESGILYSAVDSKARVNAEMNKLPKINEYLAENKEKIEEMVAETAENLLEKAINQMRFISPEKVEEMVNLVINHYENLNNDEEEEEYGEGSNVEESSGLSSEEEREIEEESSNVDDIKKFKSLYDYASQLSQPQIPQLPIPLDSRLSPAIIHYNSTYQPYYEACYKELNNYCRNVKNSKYYNIFYPLENIKIQISIKTPNFQKSAFCEGEACVIACAGKNDFLAVQNWKGLALVQGGKIVSDFCEDDQDRGRGWKDVVFLEKGNIWDTWTRNRARLGSGTGGLAFMSKGKSKSGRKERLSNRSVGGKQSSKRRRRERLSHTSQREERLSDRSIGGLRRERLSNTSDTNSNLALNVQNHPPAEGLSVSSVGEKQIYKKGFYYLYDHMAKGIFRRDLGPNSQPQKLMSFNGSSMAGRVIRVGLNEYGSEDHLVLNQQNENLVYLDVQNLQKFDIVPRGEFYENLYIWDFHTLSDNRVAILTNCGFMILLKYFPETKTTFLLSEFQIDLTDEEEAYCMAVCPKSKVICVNITRNGNRLSRLVVFEVDDDYLQKKDELMLYDGVIEDIKTMEFYDYFQEKLILTALTGNEPLTMFGFLYDGVNLREFVQRKVLSDLQLTYRLSRIEGGSEGLITADTNWCLIQIKYKS